ncbi:hypothetical protein [Streptomyces sp. NPDC054842]
MRRGRHGRGALPSKGGAPAPAKSRASAPGEGSKDPDDINGDGHRDLLVHAGPRESGTEPSGVDGSLTVHPGGR